MRSLQNPLEVAQGIHHRNDVILDITKVEANFHAGGDLVVLVAALGKALEDVGFSTKETHEAHNVLTKAGKPRQEGVSILVIGPCPVHVIIEHISRVLDLGDGRTKIIDDIVTVAMC